MDIIEISSSLIKSFYFNGEEINHCPRKIKATIIDKTHSEDKEVFTKGKLLEQAAGIGSAYPDEPPARLKRKALTAKQIKDATEAGINESEFPYMGEMLVDEQRIRQQAENFNRLLPFYGANIDRCQVKIETEWEEKMSSDFSIILKGTVDFMSPFVDYSKDVDVYYEDAVHDLKGTSNIYQTDPKSTTNWAFPSLMDNTQFKLYHKITGLPVVVWVFDWSPKNNYRIFRVSFDEMNMHSLNQDIFNTVKKWAEYEDSGWKENSNYESCKTCPLSNECSKKVFVKPSISIHPCH